MRLRERAFRWWVVAGMIAAGPALAAVDSAARTSPRVVLISLDGVAMDELMRLEKEGALAAGGFRPFFDRGQVAEKLLPVDPTVTAPNHVTLATGRLPGETGIVGNRLRLPGQRPGQHTSGFAAEIAVETLWEAARRQGKKVAVLTWPGADNENERRRGDWGLAWVEEPDYPPVLAVLPRRKWRDEHYGRGPGPAARWSWPPEIPTYSPPLTTSLSVQPRHAFMHHTYDFIAIDRSDDGAVNYDALVVSRFLNPAAGVVAVLEPGQWLRLEHTHGPGRPDDPTDPLVAWVKLIDLDPGLERTRIYIGGSFRTAAYPDVFDGELRAHSLVWPGMPDSRSLHENFAGKPGIDLTTWVEQAERFAVFVVDAILAGAERHGWDLLMTYFPTLDEAGHDLLLVDPRQQGYSPPRAAELAAARRRLWQAVDRQLARLLAAVDLERTTVVLVSDHGMAPLHTEVELHALFVRSGLLRFDVRSRGLDLAGGQAEAVSSGGIAHVYLNLVGREPSGVVPVAEAERRLADLTSLLRGLEHKGERPVARVASRAEAERLGLGGPRSGDLVLFASPGYSFSTEGLVDAEPLRPSRSYGMHGYLRDEPSMTGIFLAVGKGIEPGRIPTLANTEVAAKISAWLSIEPPRATPPAAAPAP